MANAGSTVSAGEIQRSLALQLQPNIAPTNPAPADASSNGSAVDVEELVEKVWRKLSRQLAVERERRGGMTWS